MQVMTDTEVQKIAIVAKTMEDNNDSEVQFITETENEREIVARQETLPQMLSVTTVSDSTGTTPDIFRSPLGETEQIVAD